MKIAIPLAVVSACFLFLATADEETSTKSECAFTKKSIAKPHCNINVCFALDGSSSISSSSYKIQQTVVRDVVNYISTGNMKIGLAAVQYGISSTAISPFTVDRKAFLSALAASTQLKLEGKFVTAGLNYCISELYEKRGRKNHIVLFGDGKSNVGSDPGDRAALFFKTGGVVYAVGVGDPQNITALTDIAGGARQGVFGIKGNYSACDASIDLSKSLCSGDAPSRSPSVTNS